HLPDFSGRGFREFVAELNFSRDHKIFQVHATVPDDIGFSESAAGRDYESFDDLAQDRIGDADNGGFAHAGNGEKDVLNFGRRAFSAPALDDVILPADEVKEPFVIGAEEIATVTNSLARQRAGTKALGGQFGGHPVAAHDVPATNDQFADLPWGQAAAG